MISRKCARLIAEVYETTFSNYRSDIHGGFKTLDDSIIYDFLFDNDYPAYLCNLVKRTKDQFSTRRFKEFIMRLHTGESLCEATLEWSWEQRERLGQYHIKNLVEDIINYWNEKDPPYTLTYKLQKTLELDGYIYKDSRLLEPETDALDVKEELGVLQSLFTELSLQNKEVAFHHLDLTEEHYIAKRWEDSIANSRKFFECVLQEVAARHSVVIKRSSLPEDIFSKPFKVRDYLEKEGLLESKEKQAIASVYGLLSATGGHPYMAQREQARLLRHLGLTFSQFVMLRLSGLLRGCLETKPL